MAHFFPPKKKSKKCNFNLTLSHLYDIMSSKFIICIKNSKVYFYLLFDEVLSTISPHLRTNRSYDGMGC